MTDLSTEEEIFAAASDPVGDDDAPVTAAAPEQEAPQTQDPPQEPAPEAPPAPPQAPEETRQAGGDLSVALREERDRIKALRADLERERQERVQLMRMLEQGRQPQQPQQPQQPEQDPIDALLTDPRSAIQSLVQPLLEGSQRQLMVVTRELAEVRHTPELVQEAEDAFMAAMNNRTLDPADYQRVANAPNRFDAAVQWFKRHKVLTEVGTDPAAYEARLREKIMAELRGSAPAPAPAAAPPQPSAPSLPSLNRAIGNAGAPQSGSITDDDIFNAAPAFGRRKA